MSASDGPEHEPYRIRRATAADASAIAKVHVAAWRESYAGLVPAQVLDELSWRRRRRMWSRSLSGGQGRAAVFVLERDNDLVGFAAAGPTPDEGEDPRYHASLFAVYLLDSAKGKGHGRALVEEVLATLRTNAFETISLWVLEDNLDARRFYEATGWTAQGASKETFGQDEQVELPTLRYHRSI